MTNEQIAELLEKFAGDAKNWRDIGIRLREITKDTKEKALESFVFAFEYMFVEKSMVEQRERYGAFAPWIEMEGQVYPPPLNTIDIKAISTWQEVLDLCKNPLIISRLTDLLWEIKWGDRPDLYAKKAVDFYIQVIKNYLIDLEKVEFLVRALEISKTIKDTVRINACISEIVLLCNKELSQSEKRAGITLRLLQALIDLPNQSAPLELDTLLDKSFSYYEDDPWVTQNIIELLLKRVNQDRKLELTVYLIDRWIKEAEKSNGLVKITHFQHALELARNFGFSDLAEHIRKQLQDIHESDLGLKEISVTTEIPKKEIEDFITQFTETENLEESLIKFGIYGPPSGSLKENKELVEKLSIEAPLQFLVTQQILDENNFPIKTAHNIDENKQFAVIRQETMGIQIFSTFGYPIIDRLIEKYDFSDKEKLLAYFTTPLIPVEVAGNIVDAIENYIHGSYYLAALLLIPSIETIFRNIARGVGMSIYHEPIGTTPGRVKSLGEILQSLNGKMDEDWRRYFYNILANPIGLNFRNRLCHGLLLSFEKTEAFILLHGVCHLRLVAISPMKPNN